jgi:predicted phosphoribosyltransferase
MFKNREEAGRELAARLRRYRNHPEGLVLALPRGGVAVGYPLSVELNLPLDVFISREIGSPGHPEYALGAISETGNIYLNLDAVAAFRLSYPDIEALVQVQREDIHRRQRLYRRGRRAPALKDRFIILVDDGSATGATFLASVEAIRQHAPRFLLAAIPVGPTETIEKVRTLVDELVVLSTPDPFYSIGEHYIDFTQVTDEEVMNYLYVAHMSPQATERNAART